MSLDDRDYMRERGRNSNDRPTPRHVTELPDMDAFFRGAWVKVVIWVAILAGLFFAFKSLELKKRRTSSEPAVIYQPPVIRDTSPQLPFPTEAIWFKPPPTATSANLTITAQAALGENHIVRLDHWESKEPVVLIPVKPGDVVTVGVPLGRYRVLLASGSTWHGPAKLFGAAAGAREAIHPMDFYMQGNQITGNTIDLRQRVDGNMPTRPASPT